MEQGFDLVKIPSGLSLNNFAEQFLIPYFKNREDQAVPVGGYSYPDLHEWLSPSSLEVVAEKLSPKGISTTPFKELSSQIEGATIRIDRPKVSVTFRDDSFLSVSKGKYRDWRAIQFFSSIFGLFRERRGLFLRFSRLEFKAYLVQFNEDSLRFYGGPHIEALDDLSYSDLCRLIRKFGTPKVYRAFLESLFWGLREEELAKLSIAEQELLGHLIGIYLAEKFRVETRGLKVEPHLPWTAILSAYFEHGGRYVYQRMNKYYQKSPSCTHLSSNFSVLIERRPIYEALLVSYLTEYHPALLLELSRVSGCDLESPLKCFSRRVDRGGRFSRYEHYLWMRFIDLVIEDAHLIKEQFPKVYSSHP